MPALCVNSHRVRRAFSGAHRRGAPPLLETPHARTDLIHEMSAVIASQIAKVHAFLDVRACLVVVISCMAFIGVRKALGKMPHPGSRLVGRGEFIGAMCMMLPGTFMQGLGRALGAALILTVMGAMIAIKPNKLVTEATFITLSSKILAVEWVALAAGKHKELATALDRQSVMACAIISGFIMGLGVKMTGASTTAGAKRAKRA